MYKMFQKRSVKMFQDRSVKMLPENSALWCQRKTAELFLDRNVKVSGNISRSTGRNSNLYLFI